MAPNQYRLQMETLDARKKILSDTEFSQYCNDNQSVEGFVKSMYVLPDEYNKSLFSLVSESSISRIFLTEKTAIPLLTA